MNVANAIKTIADALHASAKDDRRIAALPDDKLKFELQWNALWGSDTKALQREANKRGLA